MVERPTPAHWLRANKLSRMPRCHICFDSEAVVAESVNGEVQTFRCAVAVHDHQTDKGKPHQAPEWGTFDSPRALWEWVTARCLPGRRTVLVAHNIGYDLRVCDAFRILPALGWECVAVRLDSGQSWAQWRNGKRSLSMVDSMSWVNLSLAKIAGAMGMSKVDLPEQSGSPEAWVERCTRDVVILRSFWRRVLDWLESADMGNWKPTGAGQGWAAFRHRWLTHRVLCHDDPRAREAEREAAWSGRCEAWRWGVLDGGPWDEWDLSAAYAHVARDTELPTVLLGHMGPRSTERALEGRTGRATLVRARVTTDVPIVPTRGDRGILWPVGTFESWLWDCEVALARDNGARVEALHGFDYRTAPLLRDWGDWVLGVLSAPDAETDPIVRAIVKGWSRSLIGRFGARWTSWDEWGEPQGPDVTLSWLIDGRTGEGRRLLRLGDRMTVEGDANDAPDSAVSVMSYVMAVGRVRLWRVMVGAGLDRLAYVDTDGVVVDPGGSASLALADMPGLRLKSRWLEMEVLGPRQFVVDGCLRASGVPRRATRTGPRTWDGEVWRGLGSSLAHGEPDRVRISRRRWTLTGTDNRRAHEPDGSTSPFRVGAS